VKIHNVPLLLTKSLKLRLLPLRGATLATLLSYIEDRLKILCSLFILILNDISLCFMLAT
jgi:hypothetical protein